QSDVYALGALLHKMLTGENINKKTTSAPSDEPLLHMPKDLTAIIERCLSEAITDRYDSVDALRRDIEAYNTHHPVSARQQNRSYRSGKFLRRNRLLTGATLAIVAGLGAGLTVALWQNQVAHREAARAEQVSVFLKSLFERSSPTAAGEKDITLREIMDEASERLPMELETAPDVRNEIKQLIANGYTGIGEYEKSFPMHQEVLDYWREAVTAPHLNIVEALQNLGSILAIQGEYEKAAATQREALSQLEALGMADSVEAAQIWSRLGQALGRPDPQAASKAMQKAHEINLVVRPNDPWVMVRSLGNVGNGLRDEGKAHEAMTISLEALALAEKNGERLAPDILALRCNLALDYISLGMDEKARPAQKECLNLSIERLGVDHPNNVGYYNNLGSLDIKAGRLREAEKIFVIAVALAENKLSETSLIRLAAEINYSTVLWQSGRATQSASRMESVLVRMESTFGKEHPASNRVRSILGRVTLDLDQPALATSLITQSMEGLSPAWRADATLWLAECKLKLGDKTEAEILVRESLELRQSNPFFTPWQIAEASYILALATNDTEMRASAKNLFQTVLPEIHFRRMNAEG
ncbi:MAG: tetratricopeptide repeat-containing protein kinase family protein, partial [Planctomycetota bacterium]